MKISYMLKREDFYTINEKTLQAFFGGNGEEKKLFIYPHLNAIVKRFPSKQVREYIYTEYAVNGSLVKKLLVWLYTRLCLNSFGLLADRTITLPAKIGNSVLIYPCNRKFRIFDFAEQTVSVITKWGFSQNSLHNEIRFRTQCPPADFILPIDKHTDNTYTEHIIEGIPLARIPDNDNLKDIALALWQEYAKESRKAVGAAEYAGTLRARIAAFKDKIKEAKPMANLERLDTVSAFYLDIIERAEDTVELIQSHGDLQPGNIWLENSTGRIFIIDWESVETRSIWYDPACLHGGIRIQENLNQIATQRDMRSAVITVEEIIYRLNELCELPYDYGTDDFNALTAELEKCCHV